MAYGYDYSIYIMHVGISLTSAHVLHLLCTKCSGFIHFVALALPVSRKGLSCHAYLGNIWRLPSTCLSYIPQKPMSWVNLNLLLSFRVKHIFSLFFFFW